MRLLQRTCYGGHGNSNRHKIVFGIFYDRNHAHVEQREIGFYILVHLLPGHLGISEQRRISFIYKVENSVRQVCAADFLARFYVMHVKIQTLHYNVCHSLVSVGHTLGHIKFFLYPVGLLFISQRFHVFGVIRIIVYRCHCGQLVEALNEHPFCINVCKTERTYYIGHAFCLAPLADSIEQSPGNLAVVNEVNPSETHIACVPRFIGSVVYYSRHAPHKLPFLVGKKVFRIAELESRIFFL